MKKFWDWALPCIVFAPFVFIFGGGLWAIITHWSVCWPVVAVALWFVAVMAWAVRD